MSNQLQCAYDDDFLIEKLICVIRKLRKFPTYREIHVEKNADPELPSKNAFHRLGTKEVLAGKVMDYCSRKDGYDDIIDYCEPIRRRSSQTQSDPHTIIAHGEVYLFKSGRYYKIGKTSDTVRRGKELRIQLPEKCTMIHSIKTDDPSGVEAYWHRRFEAKRMQGEWFDLRPSDVMAFKRWKRIV